MLLKHKHSLSLRLSHWLNVPIILMLVWSGILIYWAYPAYISMPAWAVEKFNLHHRLAEGMGWHFTLMWALIANGIFFVIYSFVSGHWRALVPTSRDLKNLIPFILSDLRISKRKFPETDEYNPAQKVAYTGALIMGFGAVITGFAIFKPVLLGWLTALCGGYQTARFLHFAMMIGLVLFLIVHLIQVGRSGWATFQSMISGYEHEQD